MRKEEIKVPMRSGELAKLTGVSTDTLRHYERRGVLDAPHRSPNGYREYPSQALDRVRLVRRALAVGFTLDELALILKARDRGYAPCRDVRELAAMKLAEIEMRLAEIKAVRGDLRAILQDWDTRLAKTASGERALLLEALIASDGKAHRRKRPILGSSWARGKRGSERTNDE